MKRCADANDLKKRIRSAHATNDLQLLLHTDSTWNNDDQGKCKLDVGEKIIMM